MCLCYRQELDESDEYCPHCDNHYVIEAIEPEDAQSNQPIMVSEELLQNIMNSRT